MPEAYCSPMRGRRRRTPRRACAFFERLFDLYDELVTAVEGYAPGDLAKKG